MKRSILSIILAISLVVSLGVAVGATDPSNSASEPSNSAAGPEESVEESQPAGGTNGNSQTVLKGTVKATKIKATVPSSVSFIVDPTAEAGKQVIQPEITITNDSMVPVYANISMLDVDTASSVKLVDTVSYLKRSKGLMFALLAKEVAINYDNIGAVDPTMWLTSDSVDADSGWLYSLRPDDCGFIEAKGGTMDLTIHAYTKTGWSNKDKFTITPTIVISLLAPESDNISNLPEMD